MWTARFLSILVHHNSLWNGNSGHCFPMCNLVFSTAASYGRVGSFEAVFCFSYERFILSGLLWFQQLLPLVFWKLSWVCNCKCVMLRRSFDGVMHFPLKIWWVNVFLSFVTCSQYLQLTISMPWLVAGPQSTDIFGGIIVTSCCTWQVNMFLKISGGGQLPTSGCGPGP